MNCNTSVDEVFPDKLALRTSAGEQYSIPVDLVICTAGVQQSRLVQSLPLTKDPAGRLLTDRTLQCVGQRGVFALGDCSAVDGDPLSSTAQVAMQQANIVAENLRVFAGGFNFHATCLP